MKYIFTILSILFLPISSFKEMKPKFCVDCKYFITDNKTGRFGKCSLSPIRENNMNWLVNGIHCIEEYQYCSLVRSTEDMCGTEGKMYKKKYIKKGHLK
jgi:hypothetical protein